MLTRIYLDELDMKLLNQGVEVKVEDPKGTIIIQKERPNYWVDKEGSPCLKR